jgi:hypothetical protein
MWRRRLRQLAHSGVEGAVVVQLDLAWLRPEMLALRNEIDFHLAELAFHRPDVEVVRLILHSLPAPADGDRLDLMLEQSFNEWIRRLALSYALVNHTNLRSTVVRRLIIPGRLDRAPLPDTFQLRRRGRWTGQAQALRALELIGRPNGTTLQERTELDVPHLDDDPSSLL